jgi:hypothetical protein
MSAEDPETLAEAFALFIATYQADKGPVDQKAMREAFADGCINGQTLLLQRLTDRSFNCTLKEALGRLTEELAKESIALAFPREPGMPH